MAIAEYITSCTEICLQVDDALHGKDALFKMQVNWLADDTTLLCVSWLHILCDGEHPRQGTFIVMLTHTAPR